MPSGQPSVDEAIRAAIAGRRYQVGGKSRSGKPVGWRRAVIAEISDLRILDRGFAGSRPASSGRHMKWDQLIATVSPRS